MSSISKSDIDKNFGKILRDFRLKNKLTQEQLSEKLGISLKYISRIENGNNGVKTQTLINYMNILGITPNTIYAPFITNPEVAKDIEISEKLSTLSDDKKDFLNSMIDLLKNLD
jgi:transcriptional regulator with XRE-family HTH domain